MQETNSPLIQALEANLAFSVEDPDFKGFLPPADNPEEVLNSRWTDFNTHDPGVTSLEAILFSFEDLTYKYNLPIADILQGEDKNALSSWSLAKLFTQYAISENDYRRVLGCFMEVLNAVILPTDNANTSKKDYELACLMNVEIASIGMVDPNKLERALLKNRAIGEYFNRLAGQSTFIRENVVNIDVKIEFTALVGQNTDANKATLRQTLEDYLLPELGPINFREIVSNDHSLTDIYSGPENKLLELQKTVINNPKHLDIICYRKSIIVAKLYKLIQNLPFVLSVELLQVKLEEEGDYVNSVLELGEFKFTQLANLIVNGKELQIQVETNLAKGDHTISCYDGPTHITGDYKDLGQFNSIQLSFPGNYKIGNYIVPSKVDELNPTANFRTFLAFIDQIRGDISSQMGNLPIVFSIDDLKDKIATKELSNETFYKGLGIPIPNKVNEKQNEWFEDTRLNYQLALNGWAIVEKIPYIGSSQDLLRIKREYLKLVHMGLGIDSIINKNLNAIFQASSLVLLQERIRIVLSTDVRDVRILEHCFLQPVANGKLGLNFELSVFLFLKEEVSDASLVDSSNSNKINKLKVYALTLIANFIPALVIPNTIWSQEKDLAHFDDLLKIAYPSEDIFYFNAEFQELQLNAMTTLMNDWVLRDENDSNSDLYAKH
ncbi:MAG: hypothetical protein JKY48_03165 [Flavobacteriales bacterium]|nr:hypothetical protein [Flavobacteriales bacterium]